MCGIAGYLKKSTLTSINLNLVLDKLSHRGPDDSGIFEDKNSGIGLAHTRLSILDLSTSGHQPMFSLDKNLVIIFNGEIYNFKELRVELEQKGIIFRGHSDTEVLLNLYLSEGEKMLSRLNGIFALAIWNKITKNLLVARDAFGVKPLYYSNQNKEFFFASEIKALLQMLPEIGSIDEASIQRYLTFIWCPHRGTPLRSVHKLLAGEAIILNDGHIVRQWNWYQLPVFRSNIKSIMTYNDAVKGTYNHLRNAVHRQMVADVPVGAFLSGGLDSSSVVALAREKNPNIHCFTIESEIEAKEGFVNDLPYAQSTAEFLKVPLHIVKIDSKNMAYDLERMVIQLEEPIADPASLNVLYISQLARHHGIKVLLSGLGGDDLFTGYRRHQALMLAHWWSWLPNVVQSGLSKMTKRLDQRYAFGRRLNKLLNNATLSGDERLVNYFRWINLKDLQGIYSDNFYKALVGSKAESPMVDFLKTIPSNTSQLERMLALEQRFFLTDHNLLYTDKMSMAAGVEVRVPFLDLDLVDFAAQIPNQFKQRGQEGKWILKKAMETHLPLKVIYRSKSGFGAPLRKWIRHELRELLGDLLSKDSLQRRGLFNPMSVQKMIKDNQIGKIDASYTLLSLLCVEIWCRNFIDKK